VEYVSWHWIFLVNVPIGIVALAITALYIREHREANPGRFDPFGFVLSAAGLALVVFALAEAGDRGFDDQRVIVSGLVGLALLAAFAIVEFRVREPMLDLRIYRDPLFRACNLAWLVTMFGGASMIFLLTLELQAARGLSALEAGLTTFTMAIGVMIIAQPASRIYRVVGPRRMIAVGLLVSAFVTLLIGQLDLDANLWLVRVLMLARGLGFGFVLVPLQAATYAQVTPAETGRATALYNATSQAASSFGVAVAATYLTNRLTQHDAQLGNPLTQAGQLDAFQDAFLLVGLLSLAGAAVAFLIHDRDAAATMAVVDVDAPPDDSARVPAH
jgi:MFS family permease